MKRTRKTFTLQICSRIDLPALIDFIDVYLRADWHLPPKQFREILARPTSQVCAISADSSLVGFAILYNNLHLHNLFIAPAFRHFGLGSHLIKFLQPTTIRSKTNMHSGDPTPFYEKLGYKFHAFDERRKHIAILRRPHTCIFPATPT